MFKVVLEKAEEQEIKLPTPAGLAKEQESFRKTSISALPDPVAIPGELVHPSNESSWGLPSGESEHQSKREPGIPLGGMPSHSSRGSFTPAQLSHQSGSSRGQHGWNFFGASRNVAETSNQETKHNTGRV